MIFEGDPLGFYGNHILKDFHDKIKANLPFDLPVRPQAGEEFYRLATPDEKVGILGAGVGGLYTALILDSLDIKYEILEGSGRTGGRLFTYKFQNGGKYDYYVSFCCERDCCSYVYRWCLGCWSNAIPPSQKR